MRFNHQERIDLIYLVTVHGVRPKEIARTQNLNYTTLYTIMKEYYDHGRTNRQLIYQEKNNRLSLRLDQQYAVLKLCKAKGVRLDYSTMKKLETMTSKTSVSSKKFSN